MINRVYYIFGMALVLMFISLNASAQTAEQNTAARFVQSGSEQLKAGDYQAARDSFRQAIKYNDRDFAAHLGLGLAYFRLHEESAAQQELSRSLVLQPNSFAANLWMGELYYAKDDLENASVYWEKAVALNPSEEKLRARLERIRKEQKTEKDFNREATSHFTTKYEGREKIEAGRIVLRILEDAYGEVGRELAYYPDRDIQVILYSSRQFQDVTDAPGWSGGVFDGKIRIPIGGIEQETPALRRTLFHEYTHAVVRSITPRCPTWLNEGLAQYFEGREIDARQKEFLRTMNQSGTIPSLAKLEGSFLGLNASQAQFAYLCSLSSVRYMIDTFGMYRVKSMLEELASGANTADALGTALSLSYDDFELGWKRSLE